MATADPSNRAAGRDPSTDRRCTARNRRGDRCARWAMKGTNVCASHGGSAGQVRSAAARRLERQAAELEWSRTFGEPAADAEPTETVLDEIRWCAGHVAWLRGKVAELDPTALVWGNVSGGKRVVDGKATEEARQEARPNVWLVLYGEERDRLVRMAAIAHRMGIEERHVAMAERVGGLIADTLRAVLDDLDLTDQQQQAAAAAVPRHLRLVAGTLDTGGT